MENQYLDNTIDELNEAVNVHSEVVKIETLNKVINIIADVTSDIMNGYLNGDPECNGAYKNNVELIKRIKDLIPAYANLDPDDILRYEVFFAEKRKLECK